MLKKLGWLFVGLFSAWFFPGFYLLTQEGGHCLTARQMGAQHARLYLGCDYDNANITNATVGSGITVCPSYFYRFILQSGYCDPDWTPLTIGETVWYFMSGSFYGLVFNYILLLIGFVIYGLYTKQINKKNFLLTALQPFTLFTVIENSLISTFGMKVLLIVSLFGYLLHINRIFYGMIPMSPIEFMFPLNSDYYFFDGDGVQVWMTFLSNKDALLCIGYVFWLIEMFCIGYTIDLCYRTYRRIVRNNTINMI